MIFKVKLFEYEYYRSQLVRYRPSGNLRFMFEILQDTTTAITANQVNGRLVFRIFYNEFIINTLLIFHFCNAYNAT